MVTGQECDLTLLGAVCAEAGSICCGTAGSGYAYCEGGGATPVKLDCTDPFPVCHDTGKEYASCEAS